MQESTVPFCWRVLLVCCSLYLRGTASAISRIGNPADINRVAEALQLPHHEKNYFLALVDTANAHTAEQKSQARARAQRMLKNLVTTALPEEGVHTVLSQWYHLAIRELVFLPDFSPDGNWVAAKLRHCITCEQANASIHLLLRHGFLTINAQGIYRAAEPVLDTGNAHASSAMMRAHIDVFRHWAQLLPELNSQDHELGLLNIPIATDKIPELRSRVRATMRVFILRV